MQDKFFQPRDGLHDQRGNCVSACVASLLDLPLAAVPNFVEIEILGGPDWWTHLFWYLKISGWVLVVVDPRNPPAGYYCVGGLSTRATEDVPIHHAVLYKDGRLAHDPHPDGTGLLTVTSAWHLVPVGDWKS